MRWPPSHSFLAIPVCIFTQFSLSLAQHNGGFINSMPTCWQLCFQTTFPDCRDQLPSDAALDCVCPHATGSTFTSLTSCVHQGCGADTDPPAFISPLEAWQAACEADGHPLLENAVKSAEDAEQTVLATYTGPTTSPTTASTGTVVSSITGASGASRTPPVSSTSSPTSSTAGDSTNTASSTSASATHQGDSSGGSPLDVTNQATKEKARSLLGLTVGLVAGVMWY
ncbi:MAG: hypothetical protein HETSPECPRED_006519 [Heterodermia speciosa]|uniref:Extracellular membrane protein CFEM domain-containing protein n=1 Tax=Heterodermia speciosa TaxID=116794 RepID=A0A8H3FJR8_9LECA|nr:MAG: hypothetical protein HETSPECPRED_006519 [Heterodermia speciosa]